MADINDDIEKYLAGNMSPGEMHALEKKALNDQFLAEAMDGASTISSSDFAADILAVQQKIIDHKVNKPWFTSRRIAASILLFFVTSYLIYYFVTEAPVTISQNTSKKAPISSAKSNFDSLTTKKNETPAEKGKPELLSLNQPVRAQPKGKVEKEISPAAESHNPAFAASDGKPGLGQVTIDDTTREIKKVEILADETRVTGVDSQVKTEAEESSRLNAKDAAKGDATISRLAAGAVAPLSMKRLVSGKITSADDGTPIPGANVFIQGTNQGTVTDGDGNYQVITTTSRDSLVVSSLGFATREVKVSPGESRLDVSLPTDVTQLNEVLVVGYARGLSDKEDDAPVQLAEPMGGRRAYKKYLEKNLRYPQQALEQKIEGKVTIEFIVQTTGALTDFAVLRGLDFGCSEEVIRLVKDGPTWKPSTKASVKLTSTVRVGIKFKLPK